MRSNIPGASSEKKTSAYIEAARRARPFRCTAADAAMLRALFTVFILPAGLQLQTRDYFVFRTQHETIQMIVPSVALPIAGDLASVPNMHTISLCMERHPRRRLVFKSHIHIIGRDVLVEPLIPPVSIFRPHSQIAARHLGSHADNDRLFILRRSEA